MAGTDEEQMSSERRLLLRQLLMTLEQNHRDIRLPVGCHGYEDWLLDKVDVEAVLAQVSSQGAIDLMAACRRGASPSLSPAAPSPSAEASRASALALAAAAAAASKERPVPSLRLERVPLGLDEAELSDMAYQLFLVTSASSASSELLETLRGQLGVPARRGVELARVAELAADDLRRGREDGGRLEPASLELQARLLLRVRPSHFETFKNFVRWRDGVTQSLWVVLSGAARSGWLGPAPREDEPGEPAGASQHARALLARLKGGLRRLDVRVADEYDADEYGEAADAVLAAARAVASRCSSGWSLPWSVRAAVAELLLRGVFDALGGGEYVGAADELVAQLKAAAWPALGVSGPLHLALYVWVHVRQYLVSRDPRLLDSSGAVLRALDAAEMAELAEGGGGGAAGAPLGGGYDEEDEGVPAPAPDAQERQAAKAGVKALEQSASQVREQLGDYCRFLGEHTRMARAIALTQALETALGRGAGLALLLKACIESSADAEFERRAQAAAKPGAGEEDVLKALAGLEAEHAALDARQFAPLLLPLVPDARRVAAARIHARYGARVLPWMAGLKALSRSALEAIRAASALEDGLLAELDLGGGEDGGASARGPGSARGSASARSPSSARLQAPGVAPGGGDAQARASPRRLAGGAPPPRRLPPGIQPWNLSASVTPLLHAWVQAQSSMLGGWVERILAGEDWSRHARHPARGARSATEVIKAATETVEGLFALGVDVPSDVVRFLTDGVDAALARFALAAGSGVPEAERAEPRAPPLTRYKQEEVAAMEEAERAVAEGTAGVLAAGGAVPPLAPLPPDSPLLQASYDALVVRANSAQHLLDSLPALERATLDGWDARRAGGGGGQPYDVTGLDWSAGMYARARGAASNARARACRALAGKLVDCELRDAVYERLYRWRVSACRLHRVLEAADARLGDLCAAAHDALPPLLARAACEALLRALAHVLLDGGPCRVFTPRDVDALEADLAALRAMFVADGEGIPPAQVDHMAAGVSSVLDAMQLETGILIDAYRAAAVHAKPLKKGAAAAAPRAAVMALDSSVLLRVLCHRAEHAASKFLKNQKIPKRLPAQSMSSRAAAVAGGAVAASLAPMHKEGSGRFSFKKK